MSNGRERFQQRVKPAIDQILNPGEVVQAQGFAMVMASRGMHALVGAAAALMSKYYWLAATQERLIVLKIQAMGTHPVLDRAVPLGSVAVQKVKSGLLGTKVDIMIEGKNFPLRFPVQYKADANHIVQRIQMSRQARPLAS